MNQLMITRYFEMVMLVESLHAMKKLHHYIGHISQQQMFVCLYIDDMLFQRKFCRLYGETNSIYELCKIIDTASKHSRFNPLRISTKTSQIKSVYPTKIIMTQKSNQTQKYYQRCIKNGYVLKYQEENEEKTRTFITFKANHPIFRRYDHYSKQINDDPLIIEYVIELSSNTNKKAIASKTTCVINTKSKDGEMEDTLAGSYSHYQLKYALNIWIFTNEFQRKLWRCLGCHTLNEMVTRCIECNKKLWQCPICNTINDGDEPCVKCKYSAIDKDNYVPEYEPIDDNTMCWNGDVGGDYGYYEKAASLYWSYIAATDEFGTEICIPYYSGNGKKTNCYQEEIFWFGLCDHIFIQKNLNLIKPNTAIKTPEIITIHQSDPLKNTKKIDDIIEFVRIWNQKTHVLYAFLSRLLNYGQNDQQWIIEDIPSEFGQKLYALSDEYLPPTQQVVDVLLNIEYPEISQLEEQLNVDEDIMEQFEDGQDRLFVIDVTPLRNIIYTSSSEKHRKYRQCSTYRKLRNIANNNIGGTILYRFTEENRRRKIRIGGDNELMTRKMKFYCDYDVFIAGIKHQFVMEIDVKSRQLIITDGDKNTDIDSMNDSLKQLTLNTNDKEFKTAKINKSGFVWAEIEKFGMNPIKLFQEFKNKKKNYIDENVEELFKIHEIKKVKYQQKKNKTGIKRKRKDKGIIKTEKPATKKRKLSNTNIIKNEYDKQESSCSDWSSSSDDDKQVIDLANIHFSMLLSLFSKSKSISSSSFVSVMSMTGILV